MLFLRVSGVCFLSRYRCSRASSRSSPTSSCSSSRTRLTSYRFRRSSERCLSSVRVAFWFCKISGIFRAFMKAFFGFALFNIFTQPSSPVFLLYFLQSAGFLHGEFFGNPVLFCFVLFFAFFVSCLILFFFLLRSTFFLGTFCKVITSVLVSRSHVSHVITRCFRNGIRFFDTVEHRVLEANGRIVALDSCWLSCIKLLEYMNGSIEVHLALIV